MSNVYNQEYSVTRGMRMKRNHHNSFLILFTGLSGAGKSVLANAVEMKLHEQLINTYTLDGDNMRSGVCNDLDFSLKGRTENLRRVAEIARLFIDSGTVTLAAFVSPFQSTRERIRSIVLPENYVEIYVSTPLEVCEKRDTKGLYAKARAGEIKDFTGISSPYEKPKKPDISINTAEVTVEEAVDLILNRVQDKLRLSQ